MAKLDAIDAVKDRERMLNHLRIELAIGEEQERRGDLVGMTPERFEVITNRAIEEAGNGAPIKDIVKP